MIPDFLPVLRKGVGKTPKDGGSLTQVAGFLKDGYSWTDEPECVHPVLRPLSIVVNDDTSDAARPRLALLIPDLLDTASDDPMLTLRLVEWCANRAYAPGLAPPLTVGGPWTPGEMAVMDGAQAHKHARHVRDAFRSGRWDEFWSAARWTAHHTAFSIVFSTTDRDCDTALHDLLVGAIAEHRRLTGHEPVEIDPARWAEVCELLGVAS